MAPKDRAYNIITGSVAQASCECSPLHRDSSCGDPHCRWVRNTTFTAEREAQDAEYAAALRADEDRDEEERQREEAEQALVRLLGITQDLSVLAPIARYQAPHLIQNCRSY